MNRFHSLHGALLIAAALLFLPACAGLLAGQQSSGGEDAGEEQAEELPVPSRNLAAYEDFDVTPYRGEAPVEERGIEHVVPARLMEGTAAAGITRTVPGFRIQILSTSEKEDADRQLSTAMQWWANQPDDKPDYFPDELPAYIAYRQPYYRVRIGNFTSRDAAQEALQYVQRRYADAFLASTTVTVTQ